MGIHSWKLSESQKRSIVTAYVKGIGTKRIALSYGIDVKNVLGLVRRRGKTIRPIGRLTDQQRSEIIKEYLAGIKPLSIAVRYGVSDTYPRILVRRSGFINKVYNRRKCSHAYDDPIINKQTGSKKCRECYNIWRRARYAKRQLIKHQLAGL